jgi:hypothetical protein
MSLSSYILLPRTIHGEPSGEYDGSSLDWEGAPVKASDYYRYSDIETVFFNVIDFTGLITIQGTHDQNPAYNSVWVPIISYGDLEDSVPVTDYHPYTIYGNWAWLRAQVLNFRSGEIKAVTLVY